MDKTIKTDFSKEDVRLLIEGLVKMLVDKPECARCLAHGEDDDKSVIFDVLVDSTDYGKVIGKQGKMAISLRTIIKAIAGSYDKRLLLEVSTQDQ